MYHFQCLAVLVELAVCFTVHGGWDSRDVNVVGVYDCVKESVSFVM